MHWKQGGRAISSPPEKWTGGLKYTPYSQKFRRRQEGAITPANPVELGPIPKAFGASDEPSSSATLGFSFRVALFWFGQSEYPTHSPHSCLGIPGDSGTLEVALSRLGRLRMAASAAFSCSHALMLLLLSCPLSPPNLYVFSVSLLAQCPAETNSGIVLWTEHPNLFRTIMTNPIE